MSRVDQDPERGRAVAAELKALGVKKRELIRAAEQGYITELACKMPECFCPEELGGASYFAQVTNDWSDWRSDWMPTLEHSPVYKKDGGKAAVDNAILAHRLCNRIDYSIRVGRGHARDLDRVRKAREEAIRRNEPHLMDVQAVDESGEHIEESDASVTEKTPKAKKSPEWKSLPDNEKAEYLLTHPTLSDRTWTDKPRRKGEKRDAFIPRVLLGEAADGDEQVGASHEKEASVFEYFVHDIPKKRLSSEADSNKLMQGLNQLGSEGWHVVATIDSHTGISMQLVLERAKTTPEIA